MISSRTPEGDPNRCPVCGKDTRLEPSSVPIRDAPCPHCGHLLVFSKGKSERRDINRVSEEIANLSHSQLAPQAYFKGFLQRILTALVAPAGAVWLRSANGNLLLEWQQHLGHVGLDRTDACRQSHDELLLHALVKAAPGLIYPQSMVAGTSPGVAPPGNLTDYVLLLAPIMVEKQVAGIVEVWHHPETGPDVQRGFLQFLVKMTELASGYMKQRV